MADQSQPADVAGQGQFEAGTTRMPVLRRHDGLVEAVAPASDATAQPARHVGAQIAEVGLAPARDHGFQIRASAARRTFAVEDGHVGLVVCGEATPGFEKSSVQCVVDGVVRPRTVQRDPRDAVLAAVVNSLHRFS
nr:hypothetical protein [Hydrogenophaga sp.]